MNKILNKGKSAEKKSLYKLISKLPYSEYEQAYLDSYNKILESDDVSQNFKDYLKIKHKDKHLWVKCYMKRNFTCGMVTSSRIESKHNVYKKYLNGNSRLSELYAIFQELENLEVANYNNEIQKFTLKQNNDLNKYNLIEKSKGLYGKYILEKLKSNIIKSLKYKVKFNNESKMWL